MPEKCTDNPRDCPMLPRIEALEKEISHNKDSHSEFYGRLEDLHTTVAITEERMEQLKEDTKEIKEDTKEIKESVQEMKNKPAKRWESVVDKIIASVIGVIVGFMLAGIFPK